MVKDSTELEGTGFEDLWADTIRACSFARVKSGQLSSHLVSSEGHCRGGRWWRGGLTGKKREASPG